MFLYLSCFILRAGSLTLILIKIVCFESYYHEEKQWETNRKNTAVGRATAARNKRTRTEQK